MKKSRKGGETMGNQYIEDNGYEQRTNNIIGKIVAWTLIGTFVLSIILLIVAIALMIRTSSLCKSNLESVSELVTTISTIQKSIEDSKVSISESNSSIMQVNQRWEEEIPELVDKLDKSGKLTDEETKAIAEEIITQFAEEIERAEVLNVGKNSSGANAAPTESSSEKETDAMIDILQYLSEGLVEYMLQ